MVWEQKTVQTVNEEVEGKHLPSRLSQNLPGLKISAGRVGRATDVDGHQKRKKGAKALESHLQAKFTFMGRPCWATRIGWAVRVAHQSAGHGSVEGVCVWGGEGSRFNNDHGQLAFHYRPLDVQNSKYISRSNATLFIVQYICLNDSAQIIIIIIIRGSE